LRTLNQKKGLFMQRHRLLPIVFVVALLLVGAYWETPSAQEEMITIDHQDVFAELRRPAVDFPHSLHEDSLSEAGCGACHHDVDADTGELVYLEGEEQECSACHDRTRAARTPALREAFHQSCTGCHRRMKQDTGKTGPTTCGECHKKYDQPKE
jgi:predicted CXXCH cytochrome family protein